MSKLKAYIKAAAPYWGARKRHARRKFDAATQALRGLEPAAPLPDAAGRTVLIFSSMGIFGDHLVVDTVLAKALERQGAKVVVALCDAQLPACHVSDNYAYAFAPGAGGRDRRQKGICAACTAATSSLVHDSGLRYASFSQGIAHARSQAMHGPRTEDIDDEVNSGIVRFAASSHPSVLDKLPQDVRQRYAAGGAAARDAIDGLLDLHKPDIVIAHHGIYVPQGIVQKAARLRDITFYSWHFGYRKSTLIFSRDDTYHRELTLPLERAFERPLGETAKERITQYLKSRITGGQDWIHFNRTPKSLETASLKRGYFVAYTSVDWDAALHFPASVYRSQFEFVDHLVDIFRRMPEHDLVIRVHPAEVTGFHPAALSLEDHLAARPLPPNVRIVGAKDTTSSYDLAHGAIATIVYNTKLGIELPPVGIPVIVAGDCWIRGKGFSYDVDRPEDLEAYLRQGPQLVVTEEQRRRAFQFAHYFYYRRCIDTPELASAGPKFQIAVDPARLSASFDSGRGLAFIAGRILAGEHVESAD